MRRHAPAILQVCDKRVRVKRIHPLSKKRIGRALIRRERVRCSERIPKTPLRVVVAFVPSANLNIMMAQMIVQGAGQASAIVFILRRTNSKTRSAGCIPDLWVNSGIAIRKLTILDIFGSSRVQVAPKDRQDSVGANGRCDHTCAIVIVKVKLVIPR